MTYRVALLLKSVKYWKFDIKGLKWWRAGIWRCTAIFSFSDFHLELCGLRNWISKFNFDQLVPSRVRSYVLKNKACLGFLYFIYFQIVWLLNILIFYLHKPTNAIFMNRPPRAAESTQGRWPFSQLWYFIS